MVRGLHFHNVPKHLQKTMEALASIAPDDIGKSILGLLWSGMNMENVAKDLRKEGIRRRAFSEKEITEAIQSLKNAGLIDQNGYITEEGVAIFSIT